MNLNSVVYKLHRRLDTLAEDVEAKLVGGYCDGKRRHIEHAIFQLQNSWESYVRELILLSATGKYSDNGGVVRSNLPMRIHGKENAAGLLIQLRPGRNRYEPKWYNAREAAEACRILQLSNTNKINFALGSTPWPLEDLRKIRNFYAHRSKSSAKQVRDIAWVNSSSDLNVIETVLQAHNSGAKQFDYWASFMKLASSSML